MRAMVGVLHSRSAAASDIALIEAPPFSATAKAASVPVQVRKVLAVMPSSPAASAI